MDEKLWYAVYTRSKWEKKVAKLLEKKSIECYCPLNRVMQQWADRKKMVLKPLFNSYVFVHASVPEQLLIKQTDGVLNFVHWLGRPAVIKEEEIEIIKDFLFHHTDVAIETIPVNKMDKIRVLDGPLIHMEGNIVEIKTQSVKVFLPSLGSAMIAEVKKSNIEILQRYKSMGGGKAASAWPDMAS